MTRQDYSEKESLNRVLRYIKGKPAQSEQAGTLPGEILSENQALSDITELLGDSLPDETFTLPASVGTAIGDAGFYRGWGSGRVFFVDPNDANASDVNSGRNSNYPLATIQQAITNARAMSGDRILVRQNDGWRYGSGLGASIIEDVIVPAEKPGLMLLGVGAGSMGVNWMATATGTFALTIRAIDTVVAGFNFWATGYQAHGIKCEWGGASAYGENAIISNCTFTDDIEIAIQMDYTWYMRIYNNRFLGCTSYGIYVDPADDGVDSAEIVGNHFQDCGYAIYLYDPDDCLISKNTIYNQYAQATGTATNQGIYTEYGDRNIVTDNDFSCLLANWDSFNTAAATDSWINNHVIDGNPTSRPS